MVVGATPIVGAPGAKRIMAQASATVGAAHNCAIVEWNAIIDRVVSCSCFLGAAGAHGNIRGRHILDFSPNTEGVERTALTVTANLTVEILRLTPTRHANDGAVIVFPDRILASAKIVAGVPQFLRALDTPTQLVDAEKVEET